MHPKKPFCALATAFALSLVLLVSSSAFATTILVDELSDIVDPNDGVCTLREAITSANTNPPTPSTPGECESGVFGEDLIQLPAGTYEMTLASTQEDDNLDGDLDIHEGLQIVGNPGGTTLDAKGLDRVLHVVGGGFVSKVSLRNLTVQGGRLSGIGNRGAGILVDINRTLTLNQVSIINNSNQDELGGGVSVLASSTLNGTNSTFSGNSAASRAGTAIEVTGANAEVFLTHVTLDQGQGVFIDQDSTFRADFSLLDICGGLGAFGPGQDENIAHDTSCGVVDGVDGNQVIAGLDLEPLGNNGGATPTHGLPADSPAIDAASTSVTNLDQRGFIRPLPLTGSADVGAYESGCPNGDVEAGEECDDGNTIDDDACSNACIANTSIEVCGNGVVDNGEQCDDGNKVSNDGCENDCLLTNGSLPGNEGGGCSLDAGGPITPWLAVLALVGFFYYRRLRA